MPATVQYRVFTWLFLQIQTCIYLSLILYTASGVRALHTSPTKILLPFSVQFSPKSSLSWICFSSEPLPHKINFHHLGKQPVNPVQQIQIIQTFTMKFVSKAIFGAALSLLSVKGKGAALQ